jgi:hypothetical protein
MHALLEREETSSSSEDTDSDDELEDADEGRQSHQSDSVSATRASSSSNPYRLPQSRNRGSHSTSQDRSMPQARRDDGSVEQLSGQVRRFEVVERPERSSHSTQHRRGAAHDEHNTDDDEDVRPRQPVLVLAARVTSRPSIHSPRQTTSSANQTAANRSNHSRNYERSRGEVAPPLATERPHHHPQPVQRHARARDATHRGRNSGTVEHQRSVRPDAPQQDIHDAPAEQPHRGGRADRGLAELRRAAREAAQEVLEEHALLRRRVVLASATGDDAVESVRLQDLQRAEDLDHAVRQAAREQALQAIRELSGSIEPETFLPVSVHTTPPKGRHLQARMAAREHARQQQSHSTARSANAPATRTTAPEVVGRLSRSSSRSTRGTN